MSVTSLDDTEAIPSMDTRPIVATDMNVPPQVDRGECFGINEGVFTH